MPHQRVRFVCILPFVRLLSYKCSKVINSSSSPRMRLSVPAFCLAFTIVCGIPFLPSLPPDRESYVELLEGNERGDARTRLTERGFIGTIGLFGNTNDNQCGSQTSVLEYDGNGNTHCFGLANNQGQLPMYSVTISTGQAWGIEFFGQSECDGSVVLTFSSNGDDTDQCVPAATGGSLSARITLN
jgi:hypothetical protein